MDREEPLQAVEGNPRGSAGQQPADIGVIALAVIGQGGEIDLQQAEVEEAHHPRGAVDQGMGAGADHAEDLLTAVAGLHGDGGAELEETTVPAVHLRLVDGQGAAGDLHPARPGIGIGRHRGVAWLQGDQE